MNPQTLLVFSKNKIQYEKWIRDLGMRVSNIQYVYVTDTNDVKGWNKSNTYYTLLSTTLNKKQEAALDLCKVRYEIVLINKLEEKLKEKKKVQQAATQ